MEKVCPINDICKPYNYQWFLLVSGGERSPTIVQEIPLEAHSKFGGYHLLVTYRPVLLITTLDAHYLRLLHEITSSIYQRIPVQCLIFSNSIFVLLTIYTQALYITPHRRSVQSPSKSVNSWMFLYTAMEYTTTYSFLLLHPSLLWFIDFGSSATTGVFFTEFVFKLFPLSFPFAGWSWRSLQIKHKYYQMVLISLCSITFAFLNTVYRVIFCPM